MLWAGQSLSPARFYAASITSILSDFVEQENAPLDVQFGPNDLLKADTYILAVINNQYLDALAEINS